MGDFRASQYLFWPINSYWADSWLLDIDDDRIYYAGIVERGKTFAGGSIGSESTWFPTKSSAEKHYEWTAEARRQQRAYEAEQREKKRLEDIEWEKAAPERKRKQEELKQSLEKNLQRRLRPILAPKPEPWLRPPIYFPVEEVFIWALGVLNNRAAIITEGNARWRKISKEERGDQFMAFMNETVGEEFISIWQRNMTLPLPVVVSDHGNNRVLDLMADYYLRFCGNLERRQCRLCAFERDSHLVGNDFRGLGKRETLALLWAMKSYEGFDSWWDWWASHYGLGGARRP